MSNLVSISATFAFIFSPCFATTLSSFTATLPPSTPTFKPTPLSSLITGPGAKGVGPFLMIISFGAKQGEKINAKVAEILTRLDIKPMEVGLDLMAAYEDGIIYLKDILDVDEAQYVNNVNLAAVQAFNLAFDITYVTKDNAGFLIGKAFNDAKILGIEQEIFDTGVIEDLLGKAQRSMLSLQSAFNIEVTEKPKEKPALEKPQERAKEEKPSEEIKKEPVKEEKPKAPAKEEVKIEEKKDIETKVPEPKPKIKEEKKAIKEESKPEIKEEKIEIKEIKEPEKKIEEKTEIKEKVEIKEPVIEKVSEIEQPKVTKKVMLGEIPAEKVVKEPEIKEAEDIYEEESREKLLAQGEISPAEEGFMKGYEEAGKTVEEKKPQDETDKKVAQIVERTKKFMKGEEETAEDIIEEVKEEEKEKQAVKEQEKEEETMKEKEVPSAHDLKKNKEGKEAKSEKDLIKEKEEKERKEVEELTKELVKKGTLRKK